MLGDFEHVSLAQIRRANSLVFLVTIKEQMYPELVYMFYSILSFLENSIHSCVKNFDIDISLEEFARILHLSYEDANILNLYFDDLSFPLVSLLSLPPYYCMMMIIWA